MAKVSLWIGLGLVFVASGCGGSSDETEGSDRLSEKVDAVCESVSALSCAPEHCREDLLEEVAVARATGCEDALATALDCAAQKQASCKEGISGEFPAFPDCSNEEDAYTNCKPLCGGSGSLDECEYSCSRPVAWAVQCAKSGDAMNCTCTAGAKQGSTFTVATDSCAGDEVSAKAEQVCGT